MIFYGASVRFGVKFLGAAGRIVQNMELLLEFDFDRRKLGDFCLRSVSVSVSVRSCENRDYSFHFETSHSAPHRTKAKLWPEYGEFA